MLLSVVEGIQDHKPEEVLRLWLISKGVSETNQNYRVDYSPVVTMNHLLNFAVES